MTTPEGKPEATVNSNHSNSPDDKDTAIPHVKGKWRLVVYSAIGAFVFFFPMQYQGKSSIPLDHMVTIVR